MPPTEKTYTFPTARRSATGVGIAAIVGLFVAAVPVIIFTILSAGILSSGSGNHTGLQTQLPPSALSSISSNIGLVGDVIAEDMNGDGTIDRIICTVSNNALDGKPVDFTPGAIPGGGVQVAEDNNGVNISCTSDGGRASDLTWTVTQLGKGNNDTLLDPGERFQLSIDLSHLDPPAEAETSFTIEITSARGTELAFEATVPSLVERVMALN